jgi:amyloid beta precursor protein binding protein 1
MVVLFVSGAAAHEVIKMVSHQFVPFNNTFIYNAMSQTSATYQL